MRRDVNNPPKLIASIYKKTVEANATAFPSHDDFSSRASVQIPC